MANVKMCTVGFMIYDNFLIESAGGDKDGRVGIDVVGVS